MAGTEGIIINLNDRARRSRRKSARALCVSLVAPPPRDTFAPSYFPFMAYFMARTQFGARDSLGAQLVFRLTNNVASGATGGRNGVMHRPRARVTNSLSLKKTKKKIDIHILFSNPLERWTVQLYSTDRSLTVPILRTTCRFFSCKNVSIDLFIGYRALSVEMRSRWLLHRKIIIPMRGREREKVTKIIWGTKWYSAISHGQRIDV